ncbi:MFS transporter [Microbacterium immunditiarum]|uniref:Putative MFS family arabinose efflux permease n=1 Tax=Microbacterium immunditiarum TaxID=337480 RepID=A0A7Y9GL71_9MICO|nr:MFS transporter [Microbacterium immunditiarum]NYE18479.1 putative MFS family arabinose efflux permease [Microbacterium immunditiarum]
MSTETSETADAAPRRNRLPIAFEAPGFGRLSTAWVFTNLGDSALYLMVAVWVKQFTGSDVAAAFVFVALGVPAILAPFIGMIADRVSRKRLLVANNVAMALIVLSLLLVDGSSQLWLIYVVIFLYSAGGYVTAAAQSGIIRGMLRDDQLASGNGVLSTIDNGLRLISPLIGTALYVAFGAHAVVLLTASCFAACAVALIGLPVGDAAPEHTESRGYVRELVAGFEHIFRIVPLRRLTFAIAVAFGATGLMNVIIFPALDAMKADAAAIGWLVPLQGVGALVGGILSATLVTRLGEGRAAALGLVMLALGSALLPLGSLPIAACGMVVAGFGIPITVVGFATMRQRLTPDALQGRTAAAANVSINVPQTAVSIVGAGLLAIADYRVLIWVTVAAVLLGAVLAATARTTASTRSDEGLAGDGATGEAVA